MEYIENRLTGVREDQQRIIGVLEKVEIGLGRQGGWLRWGCG